MATFKIAFVVLPNIVQVGPFLSENLQKTKGRNKKKHWLFKQV